MRKITVSEEKLKRITAAATVTAVVFLFVLLLVFAYQLISIGTKKKRLSELEAQIEYQKTLNQDGSKILEDSQEDWYIVARAMELGFMYPNSSEYGN